MHHDELQGACGVMRSMRFPMRNGAPSSNTSCVPGVCGEVTSLRATVAELACAAPTSGARALRARVLNAIEGVPRVFHMRRERRRRIGSGREAIVVAGRRGLWRQSWSAAMR
jgi:hypothetical protein